jgi:hypothetical protein
VLIAPVQAVAQSAAQRAGIQVASARRQLQRKAHPAANSLTEQLAAQPTPVKAAALVHAIEAHPKAAAAAGIELLNPQALSLAAEMANPQLPRDQVLQTSVAVAFNLRLGMAASGGCGAQQVQAQDCLVAAAAGAVDPQQAVPLPASQLAGLLACNTKAVQRKLARAEQRQLQDSLAPLTEQHTRPRPGTIPEEHLELARQHWLEHSKICPNKSKVVYINGEVSCAGCCGSHPLRHACQHSWSADFAV